MITNEQEKRKLYTALLEKKPEYDGVFFAGITSTGVFCHATCPARKPKYENCEFYLTAQEALLAGFRPCKRCNPLSYPQEIPSIVRDLVRLVEENPEKKWTDTDFSKLGIHSATARRQFKSIYGMTFVQYARSRRIGIAMKNIRNGSRIIDSQLDTGYDSSSGFNDAFSKIMGGSPKQSVNITTLYANWFDTHLGPMLSISNEEALFLLEFVDENKLESEIEKLRTKMNAVIIPGKTSISEQIEQEVHNYFTNATYEFTTPIHFIGLDSEKKVWAIIKNTKRGDKITYNQIAEKLGHTISIQAIEQANSANQFSLIIPNHRIIVNDAQPDQYDSNTLRKNWLLNHEKLPISYCNGLL